MPTCVGCWGVVLGEHVSVMFSPSCWWVVYVAGRVSSSTGDSLLLMLALESLASWFVGSVCVSPVVIGHGSRYTQFSPRTRTYSIPFASPRGVAGAPFLPSSLGVAM